MTGFHELALHEIRFGYGDKPVLDGLSFRMHPGELVAIVGPNGCGKSTLLKVMIGALLPQKGEVRLDGKPVHQWGRIGMARRTALVPQMAGEEAGSGLGGAGFSVQATVLMARYAAHVEEGGTLLAAAGGWGTFGFESEQDRQIAGQAMWDADVHHLAERDMETLSGGERQRVAIARALAQETPIIFFDEPTSALDLFHHLELVEQMRRMTAGAGAGGGRLAVLVTHDLNLAAACATRVLVMEGGRMVADGPPPAVLTPAVLEPVYHVNVSVGAEGYLKFERRPDNVR